MLRTAKELAQGGACGGRRRSHHRSGRSGRRAKLRGDTPVGLQVRTLAGCTAFATGAPDHMQPDGVDMCPCSQCAVLPMSHERLAN